MARYEAETQYRGYKLRLDVSESSYDTSSNTSVVSWTLYIVNGSKSPNFDLDNNSIKTTKESEIESAQQSIYIYIFSHLQKKSFYI